MRKLIPLFAVAALSIGRHPRSSAPTTRRRRSRARAMCAKCELKEKPTCQNVIVVKEDGKDVKYYLAKNARSANKLPQGQRHLHPKRSHGQGHRHGQGRGRARRSSPPPRSRRSRTEHRPAAPDPRGRRPGRRLLGPPRRPLAHLRRPLRRPRPHGRGRCAENPRPRLSFGIRESRRRSAARPLDVHGRTGKSSRPGRSDHLGASSLGKSRRGSPPGSRPVRGGPSPERERHPRSPGETRPGTPSSRRFLARQAARIGGRVGASYPGSRKSPCRRSPSSGRNGSRAIPSRPSSPPTASRRFSWASLASSSAGRAGNSPTEGASARGRSRNAPWTDSSCWEWWFRRNSASADCSAST